MSDETSIVIDIGAPALTGLYAEHLVRNAFSGAVYPIWIIVTNRLDSHVSLPEADGLFLLPQSDNIGSAALVEVHSEDQLMQLAASMEQVAISRNSPLALTLNEVPNGGDPMEVPVVDIKLNPPTMPDPSSHIVPLKTVNGVSIIGYGDISLGTLAMGAMIKELIDDTAGLGNKGVTWSADKLAQQFAGKMDATTFKTVGGQTVTGTGDIPFPVLPTFKTVNGQAIDNGPGNIVIDASSVISDTSTDGETAKTWSADKIFDEIEAAKVAVQTSLLSSSSANFQALTQLVNQLQQDQTTAAAVMNGLQSKQATLVTGSNIKTVGGESLLIPDGGTDTDVTLKTVGGQNIVGTGDIPIPAIPTFKTINGASITGSGDIAVAAPQTFKTVGGTVITGAGDIPLPTVPTFKTVNGASITGSGDIAVAAPQTFKTVGGTVITGAGDIPLPTVPTFKTVNGASITGSGDIVTGTGDVTLNGVQTLTNKTITGLIETKVNIGTDNKIDVKTGNLFYKKLTAATTFDFTNEPTAGVCSIILELENAGTFVTWPTAVKWASGTSPSLTVTGIDILGFYTYDGGSTWRGLVLAKDSK